MPELPEVETVRRRLLTCLPGLVVRDVVVNDATVSAQGEAELRALLAERRSTRFNVGQFKEWTGVSRRYAIPLLEFLDRERVTRRDGDARVLA